MNLRLFRSKLPASTFKFLAFALVCLVLTAALAVKLGNKTFFVHRYTIDAQLADVTGLTSGSPVDIAGVGVGQVGSIGVEHGHALVGLSINKSVTLPAGTDVGLRWQNVLGQKEIYLYPEGNGPALAAGATIPLSHDVSDASVNALLNSLGPFLTAINPKEANAFVENVAGALSNDSAQVDELIDNSAQVSSTVGSLNTQVGAVIDDLDAVLSALSSRSGDLSTLVTNLQTVADSLSTRNTLLDQVIGNLGQVAGQLADLEGTNKTNLDSAISSLQVVASTIASHSADLAQGLSTIGTGFAPYVEISSYGQWFQIQTVYLCLANETACTYYEGATSQPSGSGPLGGLPVTGSSNKASSVKINDGLTTTSIPNLLGVIAGKTAAS